MPNHHLRIARLVADARVAAGIVLTTMAPIVALGQTLSGGSPLARRYSVGDSIRYHMVASNFGHPDSTRYTADVGGRVVRDSAGHVVERLAWTSFVMNGKAQSISADSPASRQTLTLAPDWQATPDVTRTDPRLVGPMLDLLTIYVDLQLAGRLPTLARAGDHVSFPSPVNPSWADGVRVLRGEDAIDFDLTLESVDSAAGVATLVVKHVPPRTARLKFPASWMSGAVTDSPNNWLEVARLQNGRVAGRVGMETFESHLRVSLANGGILSARLDNPVEVVERECTDATLADCSEPIRYRIVRTITIDAVR